MMNLKPLLFTLLTVHVKGLGTVKKMCKRLSQLKNKLDQHLRAYIRANIISISNPSNHFVDILVDFVDIHFV